MAALPVILVFLCLLVACRDGRIAEKPWRLKHVESWKVAFVPSDTAPRDAIVGLGYWEGVNGGFAMWRSGGRTFVIRDLRHAFYADRNWPDKTIINMSQGEPLAPEEADPMDEVFALRDDLKKVSGHWSGAFGGLRCLLYMRIDNNEFKHYIAPPTEWPQPDWYVRFLRLTSTYFKPEHTPIKPGELEKE